MCIGLMLFTGANLLLVHNCIRDCKRSISETIGNALEGYIVSQMPDLR